MHVALRIAAAVALGAAVAAVLHLLLESPPPGLEPVPVEVAPPTRARPVAPRRIEVPKGGVYAGIVLTRDGDPVPDATVLLVAWDAGEMEADAATAGADVEDLPVAVIGYRLAAEDKTDAAGRFRIAADADSAIHVVTAYRRGFMPEMAAVRAPREDLRLVLQVAGQVVGTVVDDETDRPVPSARITINLQQRSEHPGATGPGGAPGRARAVTPFATAKRFVAEVLGPRVWGLEFQGDDALHLWADENGVFRFGPIGDAVQLEFIVTHPDYMWVNFDQQEDGTVRRTVVGPGETVERTFRLRRGKSIQGRVVDESGRGISDVLLSVEHVSQYDQHWWYRFKKRWARTGRDGSFTVRGLHYGPYVATLRHAAFGQEVIPNVPEGAASLLWEMQSLGALRGRVDGLEQDPEGVGVELVLESLEEVPREARHHRHGARLGPDGVFLAQRLEPGRWRAWVRAAGKSSQPQVVEVRSLEVTDAVFELGGGGSVSLRVLDANGRAVDPAQGQLVRLREDGGEDALGHFVSRGGRLDLDGVPAGTYRLSVESPGFLGTATEAFTVRAEEHVDLGAVQLRRLAFLRIAAVQWADEPAGEDEVVVTYRVGDGPFRRLYLRGGPVSVSPGVITVRAESASGRAFEETFDLADGETRSIRIVLR